MANSVQKDGHLQRLMEGKINMMGCHGDVSINFHIPVVQGRSLVTCQMVQVTHSE